MKTVTIKFGSVDNATSFVKAIEDFEKKEERAEEQIIEHALKEESSSLGENKKCTPFAKYGRKNRDENLPLLILKI